jgi:transposase
MLVDSKYSKHFKSNEITLLKYNELKEFAMFLREHKNIISKEIQENITTYMNMSTLEFVTYMRKKYHKLIDSNFDKQLYQDVFDCYDNKFKAIQKKLKFEKVKSIEFIKYKNNTKKNKKGELKNIKVNKIDTELSICLSYLSRYGNENTVDYISEQLLKGGLEIKKIEYYNNILNKINKFGFDRLLNLALLKRNTIINKYNRNKIEFKSLTFRGRSRKKHIIDYNKNYKSMIKSFISISWTGRKSFDIPIKFGKKYHGNMKDYVKKTNDYEFTLKFNDVEKEVSIFLVKNGERYLPENKNNYVGIDVNIKNNLFYTSNGETYDYDRKLVNDYCKIMLEIDELKSKNNDYTIGKRKQIKVDTLSRKMKHSQERLISNICKELNNNKIDHIVMENLNNGFGKSYVKDKNNDDINFNRIVKFLKISSLKDKFKTITTKYDISVSLVHSHYTSKQCSKCGCIHDDNRLTQEEFKCVECGYENNADANASDNIKNRVTSTVLRNKLLKQNDDNTFEPKIMKKENIKKVLDSHRTRHILCGEYLH